MTRGVRQGDSLSPTSFVLAIQILAISLRHSPLEGDLIDEVEYKISLFTDDTLIFLKGEPRDFELALHFCSALRD